MKHRKLISTLVLAVLFAFSTTVFAADSDKKKGKGNDPLAKLDLNPEQKKAIGAFKKSQAEDRKAAAAIEDKKEKREKTMALTKAYTAKLKEVLTAEQFAKFEKIEAEAKKGKGGDKKPKGDKKKKKDA